MTETSAVDAERLRATLGEEASFALEEVEVFAELDSTNRFANGSSSPDAITSATARRRAPR